MDLNCSKSATETFISEFNAPHLDEEFESRLFTDRYGPVPVESIKSRITRQQLGRGNVVLAGFATGAEINWILDQLSSEQILFVIEPSKDSWSSAARTALSSTWKIGTKILVYRDLASFLDEFDRSNDLMLPESIVSFLEQSAQAQYLFEELKRRSITLKETLSVRTQVLSKQVDSLVFQGARRWAALSTQPNQSSHLLCLIKHSDSGCEPGVVLGRGDFLVRQITPLWLINQLIDHNITDFYAVDRLRSDMANLIPANLRWTCFLDRPIPEFFEPGRQSNSPPSDRVIALNTDMQNMLPPGNNSSALIAGSNSGTVPSWANRNIQMLIIGDAPDTVVLDALLRHGTLRPLISTLIEMLKTAPAFVSRNDLDLIFSLCERRTEIPISIPAQRDWLLTLIHEHVVCRQNRRKIILDYVRHQPNHPPHILGTGWESEPELKDFVLHTADDVHTLMGRSKIIVLTESIPGRVPNLLMTTALDRGCCVLSAEVSPSPNDLNLLSGTHYLGYSSLMQFEQLCLELISDDKRAENLGRVGHTALRGPLKV